MCSAFVRRERERMRRRVENMVFWLDEGNCLALVEGHVKIHNRWSFSKIPIAHYEEVQSA